MRHCKEHLYVIYVESDMYLLTLRLQMARIAAGSGK